MPKIFADTAIDFMIKQNLKPLEPYPGSHKPWKCKCLKCGRQVTPHYSSVKQGRNGCAFCAKRKVDPIDAIEVMRNAKLEPVEEFPGSKNEWKCRCLQCGGTVFPKYTNIQSGSGGCKKCAGLLVNPAEAKKLYESFGLQPLEGYPGAHTPWRGVCLTCLNKISPTYSSLRSGASKGCAFCGGNKVNPVDAQFFMESKGFKSNVPYPGAMVGWKGICTVCDNSITPKYSAVKAGQGICKYCSRRALSKRDALNLLKKADLTPLEEYTKAGNKIKCICNLCNREVMARFFGLAQGEGGCAYCAGVKIDSEEAVLRMRECGFETLVKYPGSKSPWKSKCIRCGNVSTPSYGNVNLLGSGCIFCNRDNGKFDGSTSGIFYLTTNSLLNAHKIGISNNDSKTDRLKIHENANWKTYKIMELEKSSEALRIESEILDWLRLELNLAPYLSREEMPQGGYSETVDASEIDLPTIWAKVEELSKVKR